MPAHDRMKLRRIRPQLHDSEDEPEGDVDMSDASGSGSDGEEEDDEDEAVEDEDENASARASISRISFGTLARAQSSLLRERAPRPSSSSSIAAATTTDSYFDGSRKAAGKREGTDKPTGRSSKNAPQEISSKRAVTRKRIVVEPAAAAAASAPRDPRFDTAVNGVFADHEFRRNYAFLDDYRDDEIKQLKAEVRRIGDKDERRGAALKRKLKSMESQKQSRQNKDKAAEALKRHKMKERELVKQGKTPFHLKKAEIKKLVLQDEFSKLSDNQRERAVARKQKRKAQKERKHMPWERREA